MSHVNIDIAKVPASSQSMLEQINTAFGAIPNMFKAVANSPAALKSMWGSFGALGGGTISTKLSEQIAVAVANRNRCEYCLAAHTVLGQSAGASTEEMSAAQAGKSSDPQTAAALTFVLNMITDRAQVSASDINTLRAVGFSDAGIVEIIAHIALNLFTNYINVALDVQVDFPKIALIP